MAHKSEKTIAWLGKTPYGSHIDMVDAEKSKLVDANFAVLKDEVGFYKTEKENLDTGLADPYRFDVEYRSKNPV